MEPRRRPKFRRKLILKTGQDLSELDPWPGDEVWNDQYVLLGMIDSLGRFVPAPTDFWN